MKTLDQILCCCPFEKETHPGKKKGASRFFGKGTYAGKGKPGKEATEDGPDGLRGREVEPGKKKDAAISFWEKGSISIG